MTLNDAESIKEEVRGFFKEGHKSANRFYDETAIKEPNKSIKRKTNIQESQKHIIERVDRFYKPARDLLKMPPVHRSGNCPDMAALSAYYTLERGFIARDYI